MRLRVIRWLGLLLINTSLVAPERHTSISSTISAVVTGVTWVTAFCLAELDQKLQVSVFPAAAIAHVPWIMIGCNTQIIREIKKCCEGF